MQATGARGSGRMAERIYTIMGTGRRCDGHEAIKNNERKEFYRDLKSSNDLEFLFDYVFAF